MMIMEQNKTTTTKKQWIWIYGQHGYPLYNNVRDDFFLKIQVVIFKMNLMLFAVRFTHTHTQTFERIRTKQKNNGCLLLFWDDNRVSMCCRFFFVVIFTIYFQLLFFVRFVLKFFAC